ncbi:CoA pyrophosphatase [bacterium SCSIO 12741]|nr:CoA pyrophosphatase [bacterium SCSIO 12741]
MEFKNFVDNLRSAYEQGLPGEAEQMKMSPMGRGSSKEALAKHPNPKESAVLMAMYPLEGRAHTVLMVRNSYPGVHSAQVSFPGGKQELEDTNLESTALREFEEETGVSSSQVEVLGPMSDLFIPPSGFHVTPYLGILHERPQFEPDPEEVAKLLHPSIHQLLHEETKAERTVVASGKYKIKTPCYLVEEEIVWGATAMMIREFETLCKRFLH